MSDPRWHDPQYHEHRVALKRAILKREGYRCFWCDVRLRYRNTTIDHIIPASRGGPLNEGNTVAACWSCNNERGDMPAADFLWLKISCKQS